MLFSRYCALFVASACLASTASLQGMGPHIIPRLPFRSTFKCTVIAKGNKTDDTPQILAAFEECNNGGTVVFPADQNYWIGSKLNPVISDVTIDWKGTWTVRVNIPTSYLLGVAIFRY
jgi:galacturan 1,4-alpha-galacturonidase